MASIRVGIVGYRFSAKYFQLPFIVPVPDLQVYAFLQRSAPGTATSHCTVDFPHAKHYQTSDDFFADKDIDLVVLAIGTLMHAEFARKALESEKHVVVEKPFTTTSVEADDLIALAQNKARSLPAIRHLLSQNALGTITEFESHYDRDAPEIPSNMASQKYTPAVGVLFGLGSHLIDQALELFGRPKSIYAVLKATREGNAGSEIEDAFTILMQYEGEGKESLVVTLKSTIVSCVDEQVRFIVRGTKGSYIKYHLDFQETNLLGAAEYRLPSTDPKFGVEPASAHGRLTTTTCFDPATQTQDPGTNRYSGRYPTITGRWVNYYEDLVKAIRSGSTTSHMVKAQEARDVMRLIELARQSASKGRAVWWS